MYLTCSTFQHGQPIRHRREDIRAIYCSPPSRCRLRRPLRHALYSPSLASPPTHQAIPVVTRRPMVRPRARLAPTNRYAQRALLRYCHCMLDRPVQRLRLERDQVRERDGAQLDGYM